MPTRSEGRRNVEQGGVTVDGEKVGVVKDVLQHAINDVYVVNNGEKEYLIPSIEKFVPTIDLEENKMIINPIKGMLD